MSLTQKEISLIHVARNKLGLMDEDYRTILRKIAGVESSKELDGRAFGAVMEHF